jgi:hypothetical protein
MAAAKCVGAGTSPALPHSKEEPAWPDTSGPSLRTPTGHRRRQSALMLAARMTLAHFSVSSAMSLPNAADEPAITVPPSSATPPNFEKRTQGGPWRGRCGRREPSRQPDPLDFGARLITPKLTLYNL